MIYGIFHKGSGIGNQLHRYVGTRVLALASGQDFGMVAPELFKGSSFMNLDMGHTLSDYRIEEPAGKVVPRTDETVVDGEFQSEQHFIHRLGEIREWLKVKPLELPDDLCVINFRGGEYVGTHLFLTEEYWNNAISRMKQKCSAFEVHTDDPETAKRFFPDYKIVHDIELNWRSIRYAKYLILSNSSFAILPALLNENVELILAPMFWGGRNLGHWKMEQNKYSKFTYL